MLRSEPTFNEMFKDIKNYLNINVYLVLQATDKYIKSYHSLFNKSQINIMVYNASIANSTLNHLIWLGYSL